MQTLTQINLLWSIPWALLWLVIGFFLASFLFASKDPNELKYPSEVELDAHERALAG